jgi:ribonuclease-3 family protein
MELNDIRLEIRQKWGAEKDPGVMPAQVLAYIGDAVYEAFVRMRLLAVGPAPSDSLHKRAVERVRAETQARALERLMPCLVDDEQGVVRRGRNMHSHSTRKGSIADYALSTAFEALIGYLFLSGSEQRLKEVLDIAFGSADQDLG